MSIDNFFKKTTEYLRGDKNKVNAFRRAVEEVDECFENHTTAGVDIEKPEIFELELINYDVWRLTEEEHSKFASDTNYSMWSTRLTPRQWVYTDGEVIRPWSDHESMIDDAAHEDETEHNYVNDLVVWNYLINLKHERTADEETAFMAEVERKIEEMPAKEDMEMHCKACQKQAIHTDAGTKVESIDVDSFSAKCVHEWMCRECKSFVSETKRELF